MSEEPNGLLHSVRVRRSRHSRWLREGEPTFGRQLAQVGVVGWMIVVPALIGTFLGRWLDHRMGSGIFWTGPLMLVGLGLGCRAAWRWMHGQ